MFGLALEPFGGGMVDFMEVLVGVAERGRDGEGFDIRPCGGLN